MKAINVRMYRDGEEDKLMQIPLYAIDEFISRRDDDKINYVKFNEEYFDVLPTDVYGLNDPVIISSVCDYYAPLNKLVIETARPYRFYGYYINSSKWKKIRQKRIEKDGYRCSLCGSAINLNVHHISYDRLGSEDLEDLVTLCRNCHCTLHDSNPKITTLKRKEKRNV